MRLRQPGQQSIQCAIDSPTSYVHSLSPAQDEVGSYDANECSSQQRHQGRGQKIEEEKKLREHPECGPGDEPRAELGCDWHREVHSDGVPVAAHFQQFNAQQDGIHRDEAQLHAEVSGPSRTINEHAPCCEAQQLHG